MQANWFVENAVPDYPGKLSDAHIRSVRHVSRADGGRKTVFLDLVVLRGIISKLRFCSFVKPRL